MPDEDDLGIAVGENRETLGAKEDPVGNIMEQLEIDDLSELTPAQKQELAKALREDPDVEGIAIGETDLPGSIIGIDDEARKLNRQQKTQTEQRIIETVEDIQGNTELLRSILAQTNTTNEILNATNDLLVKIVEASIRGQKLLIKDTNTISFDRSESPRDIVDDNDVSSAEIIVKANPRNQDALFIGEQSVTVGDGFRLEPGESQRFPVDSLNQDFQIVSPLKNQEYSYVALGK
jgi:hypothetical protein